MKTIMKAKTSKFQEVFRLLTLSKGGEAMFNPIIVEVVADKGQPYIQMSATNETNTVSTIQKHKGIEIREDDKSEDEGKSQIAMNAVEILGSLSLFNPDSEIEIEFGSDNVIIQDIEDVELKNRVKIPGQHPDTVTTHLDSLPFEIDKKGVALLKNKATGKMLRFDIVATIPTDFIRAHIKRADFANISPRLFEMKFDKNELKLIVGNDSDAYSKSVELTTQISGKGNGTCTYGDGYEAIFQSLTGDVLFMGSDGTPCWITQKEDEHIVQFLMAPAMIKED